jgi:predicted amidophosphoribosyltransferase
MRFRPQRYQCPKCQWDFASRKKRCCPGCGTLLLIASDNPTDAELTELKSFWMWEPGKERWDYIRDWEEHKREAMLKFEQHTQVWRTGLLEAERTGKSCPMRCQGTE